MALNSASRSSLKLSLVLFASLGLIPVLSCKPTGQTPSKSGQSGQPQSTDAAKANAEILIEMMRVVWMREPKDSVEFASWMDPISQGASIEGIYKGFTASDDYRKLEASNPGATPEALETFSALVFQIRSQTKSPSLMNTKSALPLAEVVQPTEGGEAGAAAAGAAVADGGSGVLPSLQFGKEAAKAKELEAKRAKEKEDEKKKEAADSASLTQEAIKALFNHASVFTLKRVLGIEALNLIREKSTQKEVLATWYGDFAVLTAARARALGVDFGIELRNKADAPFHKEWAMKASENQIVWETLNRIHRLMNKSIPEKK